MNTYVWSVNAMSTLPNVPDKPEYVVLVNGFLTGANDATPPITASVFYNVQFEISSDSANYIPYNQLTQEQVIQWVKDTLTPQGVTNLEANVDSQIANIENPPVVPSTQPLPW